MTRSHTPAGRFGVAVLAAVPLLFAGCGSADDAAAPSDTAASGSTTTQEVTWPADVDEVYRRAEETLLAMEIDHVTGDVVATGNAEYTGTVEMWLDAAGDRYREEVSASGTYVDEDLPLEWETTEIGLPDGTWRAEGTVSPTRCHGVGVAASHLLGCLGPTEESTTTLERGEPIDGTPVVVLVTTGEMSGSDSTTVFTTRLHVDAATGLPIRSETEGQVDAGTVHDLSSTAEYRHESVDPATLDADLFDPTAMGWGTVAPVDQLPADEAVAWLGERWTPGGDLPTVVLARVEEPEIVEGPQGLYHATLTYTDETDRYGAPLLLIYSWSRASWDSVIRAIPPCETHTVNGLEVQLQCGPGGPQGAAVFDGDRVAEISAPATSDARGTTPSPFATSEGLLAAAAALTWNEPGS